MIQDLFLFLFWGGIPPPHPRCAVEVEEETRGKSGVLLASERYGGRVLRSVFRIYGLG
jgi:hypothetical protein